MESLARYIVRASFSQERMTYYVPEDAKVVYKSSDFSRRNSALRMAQKLDCSACSWRDNVPIPVTGGITAAILSTFKAVRSQTQLMTFWFGTAALGVCIALWLIYQFSVKQRKAE